MKECKIERMTINRNDKMIIWIIWTGNTIGGELYGLIKARVACNRIRKNTDTTLDLRGDECRSMKQWEEYNNSNDSRQQN